MVTSNITEDTPPPRSSTKFDHSPYMGWVTRPEDTDLRDFLSEKILEMRDSGYLYELQDKWFGFRMEIPAQGHLPEGAI